MHIMMTAKSRRTAGPTVPINCPHCKGNSVRAESFEQVDHVMLFHVIPLFRLRNTFLKCTSCGRMSIAKLSIDELKGYSCDAISQFIVAYVPLVNRFVPIASVLLCWAPVVGLALGVFGIILNRKTNGWLKRISWIGTALSVVPTIFSLVALLLQ